MAIACAIEERNCIQAEVDLAARRCRQHVFVAHHQALLAARLNSKLDVVGDEVTATVYSAIERQSPQPHATCLSSAFAPYTSNGKYIFTKLVAVANAALLGCHDSAQKELIASQARTSAVSHPSSHMAPNY